MIREEFLEEFKQELSLNFSRLSEEDQDILKQNVGTTYHSVLKKVFPAGLLERLKPLESKNKMLHRRGLATR